MHFFKPEYLSVFADKLKAVPSLEDTVEDQDSIAYYNRKYKDKRIQKTIPGAFYKVRAQGGASSKDSELINQLNKRSFVTFGLVMFHAYALTQFLYGSRIITP